MGQTVRRRVIYHGHVQGVGFRATVHNVAQRFPVTGYVRNLPDGTVELVADGLVGDLEAFLIAVGDQVSRYVTKADVTDMHGGDPLAGFGIRY